MNCRLCSSESMNPVLHLKGVPRDVQHLCSTAHAQGEFTTDFTVYQCNQCGLTQSPRVLSSEYYDDYLMSTTFSGQLTQYLDQLVADFLDQYPQVTQARVLDVGAGDGAFMYPFQQRSVEVEGIEPSDRSRAEAHRAGFTVHPGYMQPHTLLPGRPYGAFVSRQVLEHVDDLEGMLTGLRKNLTADAVGIIEVPSLEKAISDQRFYDFFPDHINYYTLGTLRTTLEMNGFTVLSLKHTMNDEYNVAIVQVRQDPDLSPLAQQRVLLTEHLNRELAQLTQQGRTVAIWGAGAKGLSVMSALDTELIQYVIDSDSHKQGRYVPGTGLEIVPPERLITHRPDCVLITAVAYHQAIQKKLQQDFGYTGTVLLLQDAGDI